ncbi:MAG TPA: hypothetical protein G4O08_08715 [Anaerolineae bacterium]|nr:hypothetical protein [Anaerolineae bacterium]
MNWTLTLDDLLATFESYNLDIWPMQVLAYILGLIALFFAIKRTAYSSRIVVGILSFLWLWTGIGFFLLYFSRVYTPAYLFGVLFILQGALFFASVLKPRLSFGFKLDLYSIVGLLFIAYGMIGYPAVGYFLGHLYPQTPPFGLTPCPTAAFTFGLFLLTDKKVPWLFLVVPLLWAIGGVMPVSVGILEDIGLILAGVLGTAMLVYKDRKAST